MQSQPGIRQFAPIPFVLPATLKDGEHMGNGILRFVTFANANTDLNVAHTLGDVPKFVLPLWVYGAVIQANPPATQVYTPKLRPSTITAWTGSQVTIQSDTVCTNLLIWIVS